MARKVVKKKDLERLHRAGDPTLPAAGHERREELKRRADDLAEQAEILNADAGVIDGPGIAQDNEILAFVNELEVSNKQPGFAYKWVWTGHSGWFVKQAQTLGWVPVVGEMPEALELKDVTGVRRLGDAILLRCPEARADQIERYYADLAQRAGESVTSNLKDLARRRGVTIHLSSEAANDPLMQRVLDKYEKRAAVVAQARKGVDTMIREGNIPGMPAPKRATA